MLGDSSNASWSADILKVFRRFKLANSYVKASCEMPTGWSYEKGLSPDDESKIVRFELAKDLALKILETHPSAMTESIGHVPYSKVVSIELLIFKKEDFKTVIEAVVQELTDEQINSIRNGRLERQNQPESVPGHGDQHDQSNDLYQTNG